MEERKCSNMHVLMVPYPSQGHINPMLQFSKRLSTKGVKVTMVTTIFISKTMHLKSSSSLPSSLQFDFISDGYDQGGFYQVGNISTYLSHMKTIGSKNLKELIQKHNSSDYPIDCVVYDPLIQWVLDVAKEFDLLGVAFFTQMVAVNYIYYYVYHGLLKLPISSLPISIPGLPLLEMKDTPSFVNDPEFYPAYYELVMNQFCNIHKADIILVNSFYKLEDQAADSMSKVCPILTIGPAVPSFYLDKGVPNDKENDLNLFELDSSAIDWVKSKGDRSVIYVSFGSMVCFSIEQMKEIALGLLASGSNFVWVIPNREKKSISKELVEEIASSGKGLIVNWIPQLEVLSNKAIGCFLTHCGWNSTLEALCLGVPMIGIPQWTDQPLNAKFVEDVWKVGIRVVVNENGIVTGEEIVRCIREVLESDVGREMRVQAKKWRELAVEAVSHGGTSDNNINEFVNKLKRF